MNTLDVILAIILLVALYQGFKNGLIVELCGILSIIVGFFLAFKLSDTLAVKLSLSGTTGYVLSFALIVIACVLTILLTAKLVSSLLNTTGFGVINKLLGAAASLVKVSLILSVILSYLVSFNQESKWIDQQRINHSLLLPHFEKIASKTFPYFDILEEYYHKTVAAFSEKKNEQP